MSVATKPRIAYDKVGDGGPAVLCLPGWAAERTMFRALLPLLGVRRTTLALDWRGHGGSSPAHEDFGSSDLVTDALSVIESEGLETVVPIAQAHAGWIAIELRRRLGPDRVPAIISLSWMVLGPPPPFTNALAALQRPDTWRETRDALLTMWSVGVTDPAVLNFVNSMTRYDFDMWSRGGREIAADFAQHTSPVAALEKLVPYCPTLHIYSQPSDELVLNAQQHYSAEHPWFKVRRVTGHSHFPTIESTKEVATVIGDFLTNL